MTIVDDRGRDRVFHINITGKEDTIRLDADPIGAAANSDGAAPLIRSQIDNDQEVRYWYSRDPGTARLVVRVRCADQGIRVTDQAGDVRDHC